ncbi:MAG: translocation/assembly module TamB domain-containing protein, partial [Devosiaceae bacterium]|nr:translocation/assembly module TamB domain-containing protein [Devosiaceae bacterium MH13]
QWTRTALLRGVLDIDALTADRIVWTRMPEAEEAAPDPEARSFSLPDLPVEIAIDQVAISALELGEQVMGLTATLETEGRFALASGALDTALVMDRTDGPGGSLRLEAVFDASRELALDAALDEPADGVVANLLNIEGSPPLSLTLSGGGPLDALRVDLAVDADAERVATGALELAGSPEGRRFAVALDGSLQDLMAPVYRGFFGEQTRLRADGELLDGGGTRLDRMSIDSGALDLLMAAHTAPDGFLTALSVDATLTPPAGSTVLLPVAGGDTYVAGGQLRARYGGFASEPGDDAWRAEGLLSGLRTGGFAADSVALEFGGEASNLEAPAARALSFAGNVLATGLSAADPEIDDVLAGALVLALDGAWEAGEPVQLDALRVDGAAFDALASGTLQDTQFDGTLQLVANEVAPLAALAGVPLRGAVSLQADGMLNPVTGAFDLEVDGVGERLRSEQAALDGLLAGTTRLSGGIARSETGFAARGLTLANPQIELELDGRRSSETADVQFNASLTDMGVLSPQVGGAAELVGTLRQDAGDPLVIDLTANLPEGRLAGQPARALTAGFSGELTDGVLRGDVVADGQLGSAPIGASVQVRVDDETRRLDALSVTTDGATVTGSLVQQAFSGLVDGSVAVRATDIQTLAALALQRARGAVDADVTLVNQNGQQLVRAIGLARDLRASGAQLSGARFDVSISDALGEPLVSGTVNGSGLRAGDALVAQVSLDAAGGGAFSLAATGLSAPQLVSAGVSGTRLDARGRLVPGAVVLDTATVRADGGIGLNGSGRVPFDGPGLDVTVNGSAPVAIVRRFVDRPGLQLGGTVSLNATARGSLSAPAVTGRVAADGVSVADGLSGVRLSGVRFAARLAGDAVVIEDAGASVVGGGTLALAGQVGLGSGLPADLRLTLNSVRYADGTLVVATASGDLALTGPLQRSPLMSGTISVERADIQIPSSFAAASGFVDVEHRAAPARVRETFERAMARERSSTGGGGPQIALNVQVNAPNQIFVRGRGVNAELGGSVALGGTANAIAPVGAFTLIRGRIDILGQRIALDEGSVTLIGDLDPFLNIVGRTQSDSIDVVISVSGRVSDPRINLSSQPPLPQDEVLSRLIFDRGLNELSPIQLGQLALAAAELAGESNGSALGDLRDGLGLTDIEVLTDDDGNPAVRAGQYVQENVYVGVEANTAGTARTTINLDVTDGLTVRGGVDTNGDSSLGVFFERDY